MRKQDISPARTIADAERKAMARGAAIEKKVEVTYLQRNGNQVVALINASTDVLRLLGNKLEIKSDNFELTEDGEITVKKGTIGGWIIDADTIHSAKGEEGAYEVTNGELITPIDKGYLFYFMSAEGFMFRICAEDDFNCEYRTDDFSILTISSLKKTIVSSGGGVIV